MAVNKHEFWQKVTEIDTQEKLRELKLRRIREYQRYFVEVQYEDLAPSDAKAAPNHLARLKDEIDRRRFTWMWGLAAVGLCVTVISLVVGMSRCRGDSRPASSQRPANAAISPHSVPAQQPLPTQRPTPTQQPTSMQQPTETVPVTFSPTPSVTATRSPATRKRRSPQPRL